MEVESIMSLIVLAVGIAAGILGQQKSRRAQKVGNVLSTIIRAIETAPPVEGRVIKNEVAHRARSEGVEKDIDREIERATGKAPRARRKATTTPPVRPKPMAR